MCIYTYIYIYTINKYCCSYDQERHNAKNDDDDDDDDDDE